MQRRFFITLLSLSLATPVAHASPLYTFPIVGCTVKYAHAHHNYPATDILTKSGCAFVAPTSGTMDEVNRVDKFSWKTNKGADRGGLFVSLVGDDGVRYYGSHLSKIPAGIEAGTRVNVGEIIGYVGTTGDSKGLAPHLHFGISWPTPANIWWVRRGEIFPWKYLDAWRAGKDLSPASGVAKLEKKLGTVPKRVGY